MELAVRLSPESGQPLHRQLYEELRRSILSGRLIPGQRIPSTRELAKSLGLSRATITQSYEQLLSEGYLQTVVGSGTSVSAQLPDELLHAQALRVASSSVIESPAAPTLSKCGTVLAGFKSEPVDPYPLFNFRFCRPSVDDFPILEWRRLLLRYCRFGNSALLDYADNGKGYAALREAIAHYLARARAVHCAPEQVIIVNGSQQALQLIAQVLIDPGDPVSIEEPGYIGARHAFMTCRARLHAVAVDEGGVRLDKLPRGRCKLLYVTPSHQFPTGAVLALSRRLELLKWAQKNGTLIIEDDYDSEFRYAGRPIPALQGLAPNENVLYVGTFSKVLFPALRIGYVVAPRPLVEAIERAKWIMDRHTPTLEQRALAAFITEGHLERHLRRMRNLYDRRRQKTVNALRAHFGERVTILGENSGMHLMIRLSSRFTNEEVLRRAGSARVGLINARTYYLGRGGEGEFVLGYAPMPERKIQEGIKRLAQVL